MNLARYQSLTDEQRQQVDDAARQAVEASRQYGADNDAELEGVLGHELTHIRNGDVRIMVIAVIIAVGYAIGVALYFPLSQRRLGGIQLRFETTAVIVWAVILVVLGLGSSLVAARRVLKIDPIEATTGGANR